MRVWLVTGASRGFGLEVVREVLSRGDAVVALVRSTDGIADILEGGEHLVAVVADVTDGDSVERAVRTGVDRFGRIDVLVNNAGRGIIGAVEEVSDSEVREVFDVNVFGVLTVSRAVLPVMRAQRSGHVVMMSSMGGVTQPGAGWGIYGASKFAVEGFSEALRNEIAPLGISVTLVEPGVFRTDFLDGSSLHVASSRLDDYADSAGRTRSGAAERNHTQQGDPVKAAKAITDIVEQADPPLRLPLGADAVNAIEAKLAAVATDVDATRDIATATAHR